MKITICSSLSFAKEIINIKTQLEKLGHKVEIPANTEKYADGTINIENKLEKMKMDVIKKHFDKIKESDAILVTNYDKNSIKDYVGGNSLIEMAFAHVLNKKIFLLNNIPKLSYSDEIEAINPIILNRDLSRIE